jgi:cell division protein FtsL
MSDTKRSRKLLTQRGVILVVLLGALLFSSVYPMRRYFAVRAQIASLRKQEHVLDAHATQLAQQKARLKTDDEVEKIARQDLGMVRPGEVPFVIANPSLPAAQQLTPQAAPPVARDDPSAFSRLWSFLKRATQALR